MSVRACVYHWLANFIDNQMELLKNKEKWRDHRANAAAKDWVSPGEGSQSPSALWLAGRRAAPSVLHSDWCKTASSALPEVKSCCPQLLYTLVTLLPNSLKSLREDTL